MSGMPSRYKIRFLSGELAGRTFAVSPTGTSIGRQREADIRPGGADIAAEHISLVPQESGVMLHVHGDESAWVNGEEFTGGQEVQLAPGADVRIGRELTFVLEPDEMPVEESSAVASAADDSEEPTEELTEETSSDEEGGGGVHPLRISGGT